MVEKYYNFDVDRFLSDYDKNVRILAELIAEKEAAADSGGMDYSHVRGSGISDPTAQSAQRREKIDWEIREYQDYINSYNKLISGLNQQEMILVRYLSKPKGSRGFGELQKTLNFARQATSDRLKELRKKLRDRADFGL